MIAVFYPKEVLFTSALWTCNEFTTKETSFLIRRKQTLDILNPKLSLLPRHASYVIRFKGNPSQFTSKMLNILQPLFTSKEIYKVELKLGKLAIELRSEKLHFNILDKLINL